MNQDTPLVGWLIGVLSRTMDVAVFLVHVIIMIVIVSCERIVRAIMSFASFFIPIRLIDWLRATASAIPSFLRGPRLLRGYGGSTDEDEPGLDWDTTQCITQRGYPCEQHYVQTSDGFVLGLHRIPYGRQSSLHVTDALPSPASSVLAAVLARSGLSAMATVTLLNPTMNTNPTASTPTATTAAATTVTSPVPATTAAAAPAPSSVPPVPPVTVSTPIPSTTISESKTRVSPPNSSAGAPPPSSSPNMPRHSKNKGFSSRNNSNNNLVTIGSGTNVSDTSSVTSSSLRHRGASSSSRVTAAAPLSIVPSSVASLSGSGAVVPSPGIAVNSTADWDTEPASSISNSTPSLVFVPTTGGTTAPPSSSLLRVSDSRSRSPSPISQHSSLASDYSPSESPPTTPGNSQHRHVHHQLPPNVPRLVTSSSSTTLPNLPSQQVPPVVPTGMRTVGTALTVATPARPVVLINHGFLQCSEAWVSRVDNLPFALADAGFDVWLANARGTKYSHKHRQHHPDGEPFWDWCLDDLANTDLPTNINYILSVTGVASITYIGFSQGAGVGFAGFSIHPTLAARINLFIALAPATNATGFSNPLLDSLVKSNPSLIYLLMGRKALLSACIFWQNLMSTKLYNKTIDRSIAFLFGWDLRNIAAADKPMLYSHIYAYSSVKSVVHWLQIMKAQQFVMYQEWHSSNQFFKGRVIPIYPLSQIACPIAVFHGGRDTLLDTGKLLSQLPRHTWICEEDTYEHMDFLYAENAPRTLYPRLVQLCRAATQSSIANPLNVRTATASSASATLATA